MKLLFITNVPSPYRVDFFNELGKYCELTVLFEKRTSTERDKSWKKYNFKNFNGVFLKGLSINTDTAICFSVKKYLNENSFDHIICANFCSPTGVIAIRYMKKHKIKYWLESDGGFAKNGKGFKEKIKKSIISGAEGYFSTGKAHDEYYLAYGADKEKIHRYPFTSLNEKDILNNIPTESEKQTIREKLGMKEEQIIVSVGQFIFRKGFDLLLESARSFSKNIGVFFIGGIPTKQYTDFKLNYNLDNVHYVGYKSKELLKLYYQAADLFVLPTREDIWGLVINEAMSNGLPIITTNKCGAGLELVKDGINGYIVNSESVNDIAIKINDLLIDKDLMTKMSNNSLSSVKLYTIEKMATSHIELLKGNR